MRRRALLQRSSPALTPLRRPVLPWLMVIGLAPALLLAPLAPLSPLARAQDAPKAPAATPAPEAAPRDVYRAGLAAAARGNLEEAARLLQQTPASHPQYAKAMAILAYQVYGMGLNRPKDGVPFIDRAYAAAPSDSEVAKAYLKTHILAGTWFDPGSLVRERPASVPPEFRFLTNNPGFPDTSRKPGRARLEADLDQVEHILANCFAYLEVRPVDYRGALDAIRRSISDDTTVNAFEIKLLKLISLFCDGHARTGRDESRILPKGYAPFATRGHGDKVLAFDTGNSKVAFLDAAHPVLAAIDGRPIADWVRAGGYLVMQHSPQWHRRGAIENLAFLTYLRAELGLPHPTNVLLTLESLDGTQRTERTVALAEKPPRRVEFPRGASRRIGDIGYLRLSQMTSSGKVLSELDDWMQKFKDTRGLVLDVRGNLGGTKSILHTLYPYFLKPGEPMRLVEMTTYRLPKPLPNPNPGGFAGSSMSGQAVGSPHWKTDEERQLVAGFIRDFKPDWTPPAGKFSEWHALALDSRDNPKAYHYTQPVIVLHDSATFSAGDIFVGAFEDHPNVTTMGTATGGGNSLMEQYRLPNSGIMLVLGWSAKFRPNGKLYDGLGIPPDVELAATPGDYLGTTDTVLEAALRRLRSRAP